MTLRVGNYIIMMQASNITYSKCMQLNSLKLLIFMLSFNMYLILIHNTYMYNIF